MKLKPIIVMLLLCAVIFSSSMLGYISGANANKKQPDVQSIAPPQIETPENIFASNDIPNPENIVKDFTESYVLKEKDGKLALYIRYANGDEEFYNSYDVSVSLLPKNDREELKTGIELDSLSDALQLVEDYSS